jgi:hypothetical protein
MKKREIFRKIFYYVYVQSVLRRAMGWTSEVRFLEGAREFSLNHRVQNNSEVHPAYYPMCTGGSVPGGKVTAE